MKQSILLITIILTSSLSFSQVSKSKGTSLEEYNYMTKGYKIQTTSGLDMKNGYNLDNIDNITRGNYSFSFRSLIRSDKKELAGILIIAYSEVSKRTYYLGMPINNSELQSLYENDIKRWDESMTTAFAQALSELYSKNTLSLYFDLNDKAD